MELLSQIFKVIWLVCGIIIALILIFVFVNAGINTKLIQREERLKRKKLIKELKKQIEEDKK